MKKLLLILIFLLALGLRFWRLGENPLSLDWDEAALGYNAYSLLQTGKDEYGNFLPLSLRSFGDYKPPLYAYFSIVPVAIWGLNEFSTRFISALFGFLAIVVSYFLVRELFPRRPFVFFLLSSFFFAISPWHLQFSRVAFEANLALFFFLTGTLFFLKGINDGKFFILSFLSFIFSAYAYHSPRLVVPLLLLGLVIIFKDELKKKLSWFIISLFIFILLAIPIFQQISSTTARFTSVSVVNPQEKLNQSIKEIELDQARGDWLGRLMHNRRIVFGREILGGYLDHFNFDFLFLTGDPPGRHHAVDMGMLYLFDLPLIIIGLFALLQERDKRISLLFWWFLVAPIASSLTSGTPHAVRALLYLPTYQIFSAFGLMEIIKWIAHLKKGKNCCLNERIRILGVNFGKIFIFFFFISNFFYYLHMYWIHSPYEFASEWQYGYKEAVFEVSKLEQYYDRIVVTYRYDQPYIFFLFYQKISPAWYQQNWKEEEIGRFRRSFGKYEFRNINWNEDQRLRKTIFVGTPGEIPEDVVGKIKEIYFPDGSVAFRIVGRQ